jgi:hypothetical protein
MKEMPVTAIDPPLPVECDLKPFSRLAAVQAMFIGFALLIVVQLVRWHGFALLIVVQLVRWQVIERTALIAELKMGQ